MSEPERTSLIAIPIILLVAAALGFAGSQGGYVVFGVPVFALCVALAFIIQWIAFIPAFIRQTEKFFDLTGSITYITVGAVAVLLSPSVDARALLLLAIVSVWAPYWPRALTGGSTKSKYPLPSSW
jgi:hypothetical protein